MTASVRRFATVSARKDLHAFPPGCCFQFSVYGRQGKLHFDCHLQVGRVVNRELVQARETHCAGRVAPVMELNRKILQVGEKPVAIVGVHPAAPFGNDEGIANLIPELAGADGPVCTCL